MGPKTFIMTVNAGEVPAEHWVHDPLVGGGRIIGEAAIFIDLLRFLAGSKILGFSASKQELHQGSQASSDIVAITLTFEDGSLGTIHYISNGGKKFPKERLEVFCNGGVVQLDNFKTMKGYGWKGFKRMALFSQDKGQYQCAKAFVDAIGVGDGSPISFEENLKFQSIRLKFQIILIRIDLIKALCGSNDWR